MESFARRLKYYGIGFLIGLVFVTIFFQNRGCSWLPSNRVRNAFMDRLIVVPDHQSSYLKKENISNADILKALNSGDVYFSESVKDRDTKVYKIVSELKDKGEQVFYFALPKESFICEVHVIEDNAKAVKNTIEGKGKIIHYPNDKNLVFVDTSARVQCQQNELGIKKSSKILQFMKRSGCLDFGRSKLNARPKAEHFIEFRDASGRFIGARAIWYKNKITITSFDSDRILNCL
jgi:hypothetical protein